MTPETRMVCRITAVVNRDFVQPGTTVKTLKACGVTTLNHWTGRALMLRERANPVDSLLRRSAPLVSSPVEIVTFYVDPPNEAAALATIADRFNLYIPGSGSLYSEHITLVGEPVADPVNHAILLGSSAIHMQNVLCGICCIVIRGLADQVARVALETGSCVPTVTYGEGAGLRDRLGLWRILIPPEKEIVTMVVNAYEAEEIMNIIIDVGKMDQPGRGFIYLYPVRQGLINLKVSQSSRSQAASIEQVILAIDEIKGSAEWRRRVLSTSGTSTDAHHKHLTGLTDCTLHCEEGDGADFVRTAMESGGAPGATITNYTGFFPIENAAKKRSPAREACSMIVSTPRVADMLAAFEGRDTSGREYRNGIETREILRAFSYSAR
jgi:nitrogen regulatory protein PII